MKRKFGYALLILVVVVLFSLFVSPSRVLAQENPPENPHELIDSCGVTHVLILWSMNPDTGERNWLFLYFSKDFLETYHGEDVADALGVKPFSVVYIDFLLPSSLFGVYEESLFFNEKGLVLWEYNGKPHVGDVCR